MIVEILPISAMALKEVRYYTVRLENKEVPEFYDFQKRMSEYNGRELAEINRYIQKIGNSYGGAHERHFKPEDAAERLPPPYHEFIESDDPNNFGLRLYCIRLSASIVILLNGDRKTALKVKDCNYCYPHFDLARKISKALTKAIVENEIELDHYNKEIIVYEDFDLTI